MSVKSENNFLPCLCSTKTKLWYNMHLKYVHNQLQPPINCSPTDNPFHSHVFAIKIKTKQKINLQ